MVQDRVVVAVLHPSQPLIFFPNRLKDSIYRRIRKRCPCLFSKRLHPANRLPVKLADDGEVLLIEHRHFAFASPAPEDLQSLTFRQSNLGTLVPKPQSLANAPPLFSSKSAPTPAACKHNHLESAAPPTALNRATCQIAPSAVRDDGPPSQTPHRPTRSSRHQLE